MGLLTKNPKKRLGVNGIQDLLNHDFFRGIDWKDLLEGNVTPPYIPKLKSDTDMKLIPSDMIEKGIESSSMDDHDIRRGNFDEQHFENFTYTKDILEG